MSNFFNRYSHQFNHLFSKVKALVVCISLAVSITPILVFSQSLPVVDNSNDLLGLSPISINNYLQCSIKYFQSSSNLIRIVQEKSNKIAFYQKSLKDLIEIYNKLYNSDQLTDAQDLIQEIQKIRIFSSRLSKSLEIGIALNKQIIRESQKKPCFLNSLQTIETSQTNITNQSINLESQLNINLEKAYTLISQTQFKKSQELISDLNSKSDSSSVSSTSSSATSSNSSISSSSATRSTALPDQISIPTKDNLPAVIKDIPTKNVASKSSSASSESSSSVSSAPDSQSAISASGSSSLSSSSAGTSSSPNSSTSASIFSQPVSSSSSKSQGDNAISRSSSSSSSLIPDENLGNLASDNTGSSSASPH